MPRVKAASPEPTPSPDAPPAEAPVLPPPRLVPDRALERPCALDEATVNSKIVVVRGDDGLKRPVLMTPDGERSLSADDLAHALPIGARVARRGPTRFVAHQLGDDRGIAELVGLTARATIAQFHAHFHGA